jgi:O-antigen ligase
LPDKLLTRTAVWLAGGAVVAVVVSIAASQILLALALAVLLFSGAKLRFPPLGLPLALFAAGTAVSLALSGDAVAGRPQLRKLVLFVTLLVVHSAFRELRQLRALALAWAGAASLNALRGLAQFADKYREAKFAGQGFYEYYVGERITGFQSHWMTFSGLLLMAGLMAVAFLFFSPAARTRWRWFAAACLAVLIAATVLGFTRSVWLAGGVAALYLVARWRRRLLWAVPVVLVLGAVLAPPAFRQRAVSVFQPRGDLDSNQFRFVCWRTGWRMIQAHPWFGLGPEQVRIQFDRWVPDDIPRPLPRGWYGHLHSIYVHYAAERGIPTALALVWLLVKVLWDLLAAARRLPTGPGDAKFLLNGAIAVVIAILVYGFFELNLGDSEVLTMFLAVVAAGYSARDAAAAEA